jgi:hypothetical protein
MSRGQDDGTAPQEFRVRFVVSTFLTVLTWWLEGGQSAARLFRPGNQLMVSVYSDATSL